MGGKPAGVGADMKESAIGLCQKQIQKKIRRFPPTNRLEKRRPAVTLLSPPAQKHTSFMHLDNLAASPSTWGSLRGQAAADGSLHPTGGGRRTEPKSLGLAAPSPVQAAAFSSLVPPRFLTCSEVSVQVDRG